jgi:predicted ArsR family transcriptional regulator
VPGGARLTERAHLGLPHEPRARPAHRRIRHRSARARDIAARVGITERAAQRILSDLLAEGYISKTKVGRRNRYTVNRQGHLRHPVFRELEIGPLIDILQQADPA